MDNNGEPAAQAVTQTEAAPQIKRHEPLYLKHRPQALDELVGQAAVTRTLTNAINYDRLSHAYLFTGPRGTGKTSSARILAKSLNCKSSDRPTAKPCQTCSSCLEIRQGISPAVFEIDAASNNSVEDARVLIERAPLVAAGGRYKVYIIDECHMLTKEAFNALLKTIEDPPPNVVFILATTEEHKVLPTIVSRCQRLMFRLVTQSDLSAHLRAVADKEGISISNTAVDFLARRCGGGLRDALGLLDQASLLSSPEKPVDVGDLLPLLGALQEDVLLQLSEHVLHRRGKELLNCANKLLEEGREPALIAQEMAKHFLNLAKVSYLAADRQASLFSEEIFLGSPDYVQGMYNQAPQFERSELTQLVEALDRLEQACRRSTQPAMHLDIGLLALCHRHDMLLMRELSQRIDKLERLLAGDSNVIPHLVSHSVATAARKPVDQLPTLASPVAQALVSPPVETQHSTAAVAEPLTAAIAGHPSAVQPATPAAAIARSNSPELSVTVAPATEFAQVSTNTPTLPQPQPAIKAASQPEPEPAVSADELDRIWSQTLEELQRRHIPTYSLANVHAIPLSLTDHELVLGTKEAFVKTLELKSEHIKSACAAVLGKPIALRIRPVNLEASVRSSTPANPRDSARTPAASSSQARPAASPSAGESKEEPEPGAQDASETYKDKPNGGGTAPISSAAPTPASLTAHTTAAAGSGIIKEAYKLFEGPGSRQIGEKK